jgi:hypothetical protein
MLNGCGVGHAIPECLLVALEVVEGINAGLGFEEEVVHVVHGRRERRE